MLRPVCLRSPIHSLRSMHRTHGVLLQSMPPHDIFQRQNQRAIQALTTTHVQYASTNHVNANLSIQCSILDSLPIPVSTQPSLTVLLGLWRDGDGRALEGVISQTFVELQRMAASRLRQNADLTIAPADLINEAVIKLLEAEPNFNNRAHFFATVSLHMRTVLVDHARARRADKRGNGAVHVTLSHAIQTEESIALELIALDEALTELEMIDARGAEILHLTYFAGLDRIAIAKVMGVSLATVDREMRFVRAWLSDRLGHDID